MDNKICHKCHNTFSPNEHGQGIVINDQFFICENCSHQDLKDLKFEEFDTSKQILDHEMPIALWLIKEQNKGKTFMSGRK
jgi:hypothetical protein